MTHSLKLTKELNDSMHPTKHVYSATSLPAVFTKDTIEWACPDEQYVIKLNCNTNIITGHFYDWDEEAQDWTDKHDVQMTSEQILEIIVRDNLLMVMR